MHRFAILYKGWKDKAGLHPTSSPASCGMKSGVMRIPVGTGYISGFEKRQ